MRKTILIVLFLFIGLVHVRAQYITPVYLRQTVYGQVEFDPNPLVHFLFQNKIPSRIDSNASVQLINYYVHPKRDTIFNYGAFVNNYRDSYSFSAEGFCWKNGDIIPHFPSALNTASFKKLKSNHFELLNYRYNSADVQGYNRTSIKLKYTARGQLATARELYTAIYSPKEEKKSKKTKNKTILINWDYQYKGDAITRINSQDYNVIYNYDQSKHLVSIVSLQGASNYKTPWLNADSLVSLAQRKIGYHQIGTLLDTDNSHIYRANFYKYSNGKPIEMLTYEAFTGLVVIKKSLVYDSLQRISVFDNGLNTKIFYEYESQYNRLRTRKVIHYSDWLQMEDPVNLYEEHYFYNEYGLIERIENRNYGYMNGQLKLNSDNGESGLLFKYKCKSCAAH